MNNDRYYVLYNKDYKEGDDAESFELEDYKDIKKNVRNVVYIMQPDAT